MPYPLASRIGLGALALVAACDVPTAIPHWQETWNLPAKATTISVASLLPAGVTLTPDSAAFGIAVAPVRVTRALTQDCAACDSAAGTWVPKPAFTMVLSDSSPFPAGLDSAQVAGDTLVFTLANGLAFDPLRPSATAWGHVVITIASGATTLARDSVDGATVALRPGDTLVRRIVLAGTVGAGAPLRIVAAIESPAGDSVAMDGTQSVTLGASTGGLRVSGARVQAQNVSVSTAPVTLDLTSIGAAVASRVQSGTLHLDVTNPFAVQGPATLYVTGGVAGGSRVSFSSALPLSNASESTNAIAFGQTDVRQLLGRRLVLQMAGVVSGPSRGVVVTPRQVVTVATRLELVVNTAGAP